MTEYSAEFPIPVEFLPRRLVRLLEPVGTDPTERVDVTTRFEHDPFGANREHVLMVMALAPDPGPGDISKFSEAGDGVVYYSQPDVRNLGGIKDFVPSISGLDYIVASRGDGSFYGFQLAEKVGMALGLTARVVGGEQQKLMYDDLSLPEFGVAEGEVSTAYNYTSKHNVHWTMSNEYLRQYLWMRGAFGARIFFYQALLPDVPRLRALMNGNPHAQFKPEAGWYEVDVREHDGGLLIQVWAIVHAVAPQLCAELSADGLKWPGVEEVMTHARANALTSISPVYLDDRFLERYEQSSFFQTVPTKLGDAWHCSPSYLGQWSFTDCARVGRNMIRVPMRELYKPKPDREILHAFKHALTPQKVDEFDACNEHIVSKTSNFVSELLRFGDAFSTISRNIGKNLEPAEIVGFSRAEIETNGWLHYPELVRLAQVAPLEMTEQAFLSRCKNIHELWQRIPNAFLRDLLVGAGHARCTVKDLGSLKLLQGLTNALERLNSDGESLESFSAGADPDDLNNRNSSLAPLFVNNDLRIADAHNAGAVLVHLENLDFDVAALNQGFGRALDHVFDGVISAFGHVNTQAEALISR